MPIISTPNTRATHQFIESDNSYLLHAGAKGSSKTYPSVSALLYHIMRSTNKTYFILGSTIKLVEDNVVLPMLTELCDLYGIKYDGLRSGKITLTTRNSINYVKILGGTKKDDFKRIRGGNYSGGLIEEATILEESAYNEAISRCRIGNVKILATTNKENPYNWWKKEWWDDESRKGIVRLESTMDDNPALDESTKQRLKDSMTGVEYKRYVLNEWAAAEGAVYPYVPDVDPPTEEPIHYDIIIDPSGSRNFVASWIGLFKNRYIAFKEYKWDNKKGGDRSLLKHVDEICKIDYTIGKKCDISFIDPADSFVSHPMRQHGYNVINKFKKDVVPGIYNLNNRFKKKQILISKDCPETLGQFSSHVWNPRAQQAGKDEPLKVDDDFPDCVRYWTDNRMPPRNNKPSYSRAGSTYS